MTTYSTGRPLPLEALSPSGIRQPVRGRLDNIPYAMPPIMENLTRERKAAGRVGHFSSRNPLLGTTAADEGSIPMPMPSTQAMFPGPMPPHLYNHRRDVLEQADWEMVEQPMLATTADHMEYHRRLHQDRGNYHRPVNADSIGEQELTANPVTTNRPFRELAPVGENFYKNITNKWAAGPTDVRQASTAAFHLGPENTSGLVSAGGRGGGPIRGVGSTRVGRDRQYGREVLTRAIRGGTRSTVDNVGPRPGQSTVESGAGVGVDPRQAMQIHDVDQSGNTTSVRQQNYLIDPSTRRPRDTRRLLQVQQSGNGSSVNPAMFRVDTGPGGFAADRKPMDSTTYNNTYGPNLRHGMAADRFQARRTHTLDIRSEDRSASTEINHLGQRALFDRNIQREGREFRGTDRGGLDNVGRFDPGMAAEALRTHTNHPDRVKFFARIQAAKYGDSF